MYNWKSQLNDLFANKMGVYKLQDFTRMNIALLDFAKQLQSNNDSTEYSNVGGWQSAKDIYSLDDTDILKPFILSTVKDYLKSMDCIKPFTMSAMWINICPQYSYHCRHNHENSAISGVYYVRVPKDSGKLKLINSISKPDSQSITPQHILFTPEEGDLVLFDSQIEHEVTQNNSKHDRVSIAFNILFNKPMRPEGPQHRSGNRRYNKGQPWEV